MSAGIRAGSSNDGYVQVNGNDIITALSGGNVGIGVSNPSTKLHVNGTVTATNFAGAVTGTSSGNPTLTNGSNNRVITATGSNALTGESSFTFNGSTATINGNTTDTPLILDTTSANGSHMRFQKDAGNKHFVGSGGGFGLGDIDDLAFRTVDNIIFGVGTSEKVRITGAGKLSVKSSAANTVSLALVDNDSANEIWRVGQASDGDGYVEVLEDGGTVGCKLDASGNSFTMGNFGVGVASPGTKLTVSGAVHITSTANTNKNVDGCIIERSSTDGIVHISAGRTGGNYSGLNFYVAGNSGGSGANTKLRHLIDYQGNFRWYGSDGTTQRMRISNTGQIGINMDPSSDAMVAIKNADDSNYNVLDCYNDNGNKMGGFSQNSSGDGTVAVRKNDGTLNAMIRSNGDSYIKGGRLLVGTDTNSISSSEMFEVKHSSNGFSYFENNSSSGYAPIYINAKYSNTAHAPFITVTDAGGNRCGFGLDETETLRVHGQGGIEWWSAGTFGGGGQRMRMNSDGHLALATSDSAYGTKLTIRPPDRTSAFAPETGSTWHDVVIKQSGSAQNNATGIAFEVSTSGYHHNAGTGIAAVKNGTNSDYGCHLAFMTRGQSTATTEKMRIHDSGGVSVSSTAKYDGVNFYVGGTLSRLGNFFIGRVPGTSNNSTGVVLIGRVGLNFGMHFGGQVTFNSYTGTSTRILDITTTWNDTSAPYAAGAQGELHSSGNVSRVNLKVCIGTVDGSVTESGSDETWLCLRKNGGGTGTSNINAFIQTNAYSHGGIREVADSKFTQTQSIADFN